MKLLEIKDLSTYKASKQSDAVLGDDFRIVASWFSTLKRTGEFKYTEKQIYNLAKDIISEMIRRGKTEFHPETWEKYSDELYSKVFAELEDDGIKIPDNVVSHSITDIKVIPKKKIGVVKESKHKRDKCMESDCELKPKYECLWAEGMGHAWFCENHFKEWATKGNGKNDIVYVKEVKDGIASSKFSENTNPNIWKELELKLKEGWVTVKGNPIFIGDNEEWKNQMPKEISQSASDYLKDWAWKKGTGLPSNEVEGELRKFRPNEPVILYRSQPKTDPSLKDKKYVSATYEKGMADAITDVNPGNVTIRTRVDPKNILVDNTFLPKSMRDEVLATEVIIDSSIIKRGGFKIVPSSGELADSVQGSDFSSFDPTVLAIETPEELIDRLDAIYELWTIRGASEQDENVLNAYLNLKSELEKRKIEFEQIEDFEDMEARLEEGIRPAFGSSGGKKYLARTICSYIPEHKIYVEPFIGGGAVFFKKNPSEKEVINDLDKEISGAYKYIKEGKFEGLNKYKKDGDREFFKQIKISQPKSLEEQYYKFIYLRNYSYANDGTNYAPSIPLTGRTLDSRFEHLPKISERIKNTIIQDNDFRKILKEYDSKETFFYLDPPYPEQQGKLKTDLTNDVLYESVKDLKGKWIMSLPDTPTTRKTFHSCFIEGVETRRGFDKRKTFQDKELLISNFPLKQSTIWISESVVTASWLDDWVLEVKAKIDEVGNIILTPDYICWSGSSMYAKDRVPNDVDWIVRDSALNPDWLLKINRLCQKVLGATPCLHQTPQGPNWRYYPLYNLALVPVKNPEFQEIGDQEPGFADILYEAKKAPEDYPQNYGTLTIHYRGKSAHMDFRRKQDGYLEGETIMTQPEGLVTEEVDTIEKGKKWTAVLFEKGKFRPDMDPKEKVVMVEKKRQPLIWLNAREVSYDPGTVGATKLEPGVFITMDEGMVYPGAQKPHFKEFFLDMKKFKGRMVERIIGVGPEWDNPPDEKKEWQTWFNLEDQTPYILSKRQRKDKRDYIPADGEKAIPPEWEQKIQPGFRWWEKGLDDKEKMHRLDLAYSDLIERGHLNGDKLSEEQLQDAFFKIQTANPIPSDVTFSSFPIELNYENNTYTLVKTKNGKLLLNK